MPSSEREFDMVALATGLEEGLEVGESGGEGDSPGVLGVAKS
jgi:hypothetical protein